MDSHDPHIDEQLKERFATLPKVVQDAMTSADVQKHMRELAQTHKLHLDQWQLLENEVMLTLLGFQSPETLPKSLVSEVGVDEATANALASDISTIVFLPIRAELERILAPAQQETATPGAQTAAPAAAPAPATPAAAAAQTAAPTVVPGTPGAQTLPDQKAVRAPAATDAYHAGESSSVRADVHNDPYREAPL